MEKKTKSAKSEQSLGSYIAAWPRGGLDKPRVRHSIALLCCDEGLRRGVDTIHDMENVVFCFVLLFRYSDYSCIGLMRTL